MARSHIDNVVILLLATLVVQYTTGYPNGAPMTSCNDMLPNHAGGDPQSSPFPYKIEPSATEVKAGEKISIKLSSPSGIPFRGFFITLREDKDGSPAGAFSSVDGDDSQTIICEGSDSPTGVTHIDAQDKQELTFTWEAPFTEKDIDMQIFSTIVSNYSTYWVKKQHENVIRVKRNEGLTTTTKKPISDELKSKLEEIYEKCGKSKGCYGFPNTECVTNFDPENPCKLLAAWEKMGDKHVFDLVSPITGGADAQYYAAFGMSKDASMNDDSVVACVKSGDKISVSRFYTSNKDSMVYQTESEGLKVKNEEIIDGIMFCSFEQLDHEISALNKGFQMDEPHHYMLAHGSATDGTNINYHAGRSVAREKYSTSDITIIGGNESRILIELHGAFMIFAWLLCASTGMFTARYLKHTFTDFVPFGKAFWFVVHITCMFSTVFLTISAIVLIVVYKDGLKIAEADYWHPILGLVLLGLAIMQVLIAFCRPAPNTKSRPLFNWVHWIIGNTAHIIGVACIFLAYDLKTTLLQDTKGYMWTLVAFVLFHVCMHVVMSIHTVWADKQMHSSGNKMRAIHPGPMKPIVMSDEAPGSLLRTFLLLLYIAGAFVVVGFLIYFVFNPEIKEIEN